MSSNNLSNEFKLFLAGKANKESFTPEEIDYFLFGSGMTLNDYFLEKTPFSESLCFTDSDGKEFYHLIDHDQLAKAVISRLKELGVRIVILSKT